MTQPAVVLDLDDFSEESMTVDLWRILFDLKEQNPDLKVTMFTVPLLCSRRWLRFVKKELPWVEMHYHGSDHKDRDEWLARKEVHLPFLHDDVFFRGFKAPWWRIDQQTADLFSSQDFVLSVFKKFSVSGPKVYRLDTGRQILHGVCYQDGPLRKVHAHVPPQRLGDGLQQIHQTLADLLKPHRRFLHVSELFPRTGT